MKKSLAVVATLVVGAVSWSAPAGAAVDPPSTFAGTCTAKAVVVPYTDFDGRGTCSGTLDGRSVQGVPVHIVATAKGLTLPVAPVLQKGQGTMTFGSGESIDFTFDQAVAGLVITGAQGGLATGLAIPLPNLTGASTTSAELVAVTVTPISG